MIRFFKRIYFTWFVLGFRASASTWSPGINAGKGVFTVTVIGGFIIVGIESWTDILLGKRFFLDVNPWVIRIAAVALYFVNYYVLVTRGYGVEFEHEFSNLPKSRKTFFVLSSVVVGLTVMCFLFFSISAYHRFFHITAPNRIF